MKNYNIRTCRSDCGDTKIICFDKDFNKEKLSCVLKKKIVYFFSEINLSKDAHIFIVGLGNERHTADSVGPKVLKHIAVNYRLHGLNNSSIKVSALEPGVMESTGISTEKIIKSVIESINPEVVILVDAFICDDVKYLDRSLIITDEGLNIGCGILELTSKLDRESLGVPVLAIGVPTAIGVNFVNSELPYLLSDKGIDIYVEDIAKVIGNSINGAISSLK